MSDETETIDTDKLILSDMLWDVLPHDLPGSVMKAAQESIGLIPSDDDGLDWQHRQSDRRFEAYAPLKEHVDRLSLLAGRVATEYALRSIQARTGADPSAFPGEFRDVMDSQNSVTIALGVEAILTLLLSKGVLVYKTE